jgi:hypothetical protein
MGAWSFPGKAGALASAALQAALTGDQCADRG